MVPVLAYCAVFGIAPRGRLALSTARSVAVRRGFVRHATLAEVAEPAPVWRCAKQCGACCKLAPEERPGLAEWLPPADLATYLSMVGPDGWCIHYDQASRGCTVYADRPWFCRVSKANFATMYGVPPERAEMDAFAIDCCREHIDEMYGPSSQERLRFERGIHAEPEPDEPPSPFE
jgi:hypothetical protein